MRRIAKGNEILFYDSKVVRKHIKVAAERKAKISKKELRNWV